MADRLRANKALRWLLATLILVVLAVELALLFLAHEVHASRTHVQVMFSAENTIVQVFVQCRLAYSYREEHTSDQTVDLGWLKKQDILTFQVRSRKHLGYYELAYSRGASTIPIARRGSPGHPVEIPESRAVDSDSWGAGGQHVGASGCQKDVRHLAFADPHAGNWSDGTARRLETVTALAGVLPRILAVLAVIGLGALWVVGKVWPGRSNARTGIRVMLALAELAVLLSVPIAAQAFDVIFGVCVVIAVGSLLAALFWLLKEDIHRLTAPSH
jgi:AraC-like DNA-binding protein